MVPVLPGTPGPVGGRISTHQATGRLTRPPDHLIISPGAPVKKVPCGVGADSHVQAPVDIRESLESGEDPGSEGLAQGRSDNAKNSTQRDEQGGLRARGRAREGRGRTSHSNSHHHLSVASPSHVHLLLSHSPIQVVLFPPSCGSAPPAADKDEQTAEPSFLEAAHNSVCTRYWGHREMWHYHVQRGLKNGVPDGATTSQS